MSENLTHDQDTLSKVYAALMEAGLDEDGATGAVLLMQNAGIKFRELAHDPRVTLTDHDSALLHVALHGCESAVGPRDQAVERAVRQIIAARLAPIRALLESAGDLDNGILAWDLRAALDAPVSASQDGTETYEWPISDAGPFIAWRERPSRSGRQDEGEKAGEGDLWEVYLDRLEAAGAPPAVQQVIDQLRAEGGPR